MDTHASAQKPAFVSAEPGRIVVMRAPGSGGGLDGDLEAITRLGAALVVSLTTGAEMADLGIAELGRRLTAAGIGHVHAPIADFGVPEAPFQERWPALAQRIHALLDAGGTVVLHCRAGLGRSGMVAARLLVERGTVPDAAITAVRAVRPGAIETDTQAGWVATGERRPTRPGGAGSSPAGKPRRAQ